MTVIYMVHPTHGAKVAISNEEAILDAFDGWERYDVNTSSVVTDDDEDEIVNEMAAPKRRGRPRAKLEG
jgi:prephenate dehydrogenase